MLLYYILAIWTYPVYMHRIPKFSFCNVLERQTFKMNMSILELLTYLERLIIQF